MDGSRDGMLLGSDEGGHDSFLDCPLPFSQFFLGLFVKVFTLVGTGEGSEDEDTSGLIVDGTALLDDDGFMETIRPQYI